MESVTQGIQENRAVGIDEYLEGMINLVTCKAAETMEEIVGIKLPSDVFRNNFSLPRLNTLKVGILRRHEWLSE